MNCHPGKREQNARQHDDADGGFVVWSDLDRFAKSERDNVDDDQLTTLREITAAWLAADDKKISEAIKDRLLIEVQRGDYPNATRRIHACRTALSRAQSHCPR